MRIIQFSDLHVWLKTPGTDLYPRRLLGLANLLLVRARAFPRGVQQRVCEKIAADAADAALFAGDLTTTSQQGEFVFGRRLLEPIFAKYGERFVAIPGNHDVYTPYAMRMKHFEKRFLHYTQTNPFRRILSPTLSVIGLDCSFPQKFYARGKIQPRELELLAGLLDEEQAAGRLVLILCHYPIAFPPDRRLELKCTHSHGLIGDRQLRTVIDREHVLAYLNGHLHVRWAVWMKHIVNLNSGAAGKLGGDVQHGPGYIRFDVDGGRILNLTGVWLRPPEFTHWVEEPLAINKECMMSNGRSGLTS